MMFLVSNDTIFSTHGITKDVYLKHILFDWDHPWISLLVLIIPFAVTGAVLYWLQPRFLVMLFKKHKKYEVDKEKVEIDAEKELAEERTKKVNAEVKEVEAKTRIIKAEREIERTDPMFKWEEDFKSFKNTPTYYSFGSLVDSFYNGEQSSRDTKLVSFLDSLGAIELAQGNPSYIMSFTDKGKYFIRRMRESK